MEHLQSFFVRFQRDASMKRSLNVHVVDRGDLTVEFYSSREREIENILCRIEMELPPPTRDPEKTPVEFFGVPLDDGILHEARITDILAACWGVLMEINRGDIHSDFLSRSPNRETQTLFFTALARLPPEDQQKCFDAIVSMLHPRDGGEGTGHIANRLRNAESLVKQPLNDSVRGVVAEKLRSGSLWKKLARDLRVTDPVIDAIAEEEGGDGRECCSQALRRWRESNGSCATNRKVMICLTNMGYGNVNWHIMRELGLVLRENMPPEERS